MRIFAILMFAALVAFIGIDQMTAAKQSLVKYHGTVETISNAK